MLELELELIAYFWSRRFSQSEPSEAEWLSVSEGKKVYRRSKSVRIDQCLAFHAVSRERRIAKVPTPSTFFLVIVIMTV